jgi:hypothetical protein
MEKKRLIMIMGWQRSGTSVFFRSLASDPNVTSYSERRDSEVFLEFNLRPEEEIRPILSAAKETILLKPINDTNRRSVLSIIEEFRRYDLFILWLFRDPVNVFYSQLLKWERDNERIFVNRWNLRNRYILEALQEHEERTAIVKYEDLIASRAHFDRICRFVGISGEYLFSADSNAGRINLDSQRVEAIEEGTRAVFEELESNRKFRESF